MVDAPTALIDVLHGYFELGNVVEDIGAARLVSNHSIPDVYDANCVTRVRAASVGDIEALLGEVEARAAEQDHRCFKLDAATPPSFEARLIVDGYEPGTEVQLLLVEELRVEPAEIDIRPVEHDGDWASLGALFRADHVEEAEKAGREPWSASVSAQMVEQKRMKHPDVQFFLARVDGRDIACFSSWSGVGGIGKVEDLFTLPTHRHRGIGTALIARAVDDARERGAGPVLIGADAGDTPKSMYAELGFEPATVYRSYVRRMSA